MAPPSIVLLIPPFDPTTKPVIESRNDIPSIDCPTVLGTGVLQVSPPLVVLMTEPSSDRTACTVVAFVATNALIDASVAVYTLVQVEPPSVVLMIVPPNPPGFAAAMYPVFASANEIDLQLCVAGTGHSQQN